MNLTEKVAFLKGLMEGVSIDATSKEGKVFAAIVDVLDEMALSICDLEDDVAETMDQLDMLDEDLATVEDDIYGEDEFDDDDYYEVECPSCGEVFYIDEYSAFSGETSCPECGEEIEVEIDEDCDCEDCDCDGGCGCGCSCSHEEHDED